MERSLAIGLEFRRGSLYEHYLEVTLIWGQAVWTTRGRDKCLCPPTEEI